ncbi:chymotrypsin-1 [Diachasma alloeum]|uniref:chymotrypsin-1 n=1 Tax=Diachasma alloeum TaxID=454923 RepID=UPI0007381AA8|nr:chymotrypsin-1 [Diachasma alloeum]
MESRRIQLLTLSLAICMSVGYAKPPSKIVNGRNALTGEFPHQVSLQINREHFCGGSIIDATHILTAAHCVVGDNGVGVRGIEVVTGVLDFHSRNANNVFPVSRIIYHGRYAPEDSWRNDIAVLTLAKAIIFDDYQQPIRLPTSDTPAGARVVASGWGAGIYLGNKSKSLRYLQKLPMGVLSLQQCRRVLGSGIQSGQICAAGAAGTGICVGDSGGPLTYNGTVIGVASFVVPCGKGYPDVYTRVYEYVPWINQVVRNN